jgi:phospholipase D-like protein/putative oligomerization/nucleic acid binding protein
VRSGRKSEASDAKASRLDHTEKSMGLAAASSSYPLLNAFWTIFEIFLWGIWIWTLITVFADIFRSHDLSGGAKALWFLFVLILPLIGVLVYLLFRGGSMHERSAWQFQSRNLGSRSYFPGPAAGPPASTADQLEKLAGLRDHDVITADEFDREKARILA